MNNAFLQDKNLSLQAKGLLAEILSNQPDWVVYLSELENRSTNGRDAHRKAYNELRSAGYIRTKRTKDGYRIYVQDMVITDECFEHMLDPITENPYY